MAIKRYTANSDTTITNAYQSNLTTRGTGSNMGRADSLEVFSIYGQESSGSSELSRILVGFPITDISTDRTNGVIPASGSVNFILRMYNAVTPFTVPRDFTLVVSAVSGAYDSANNIDFDFNWQEGLGLDMEGYTDITRDGVGANWINMGSSSVAGNEGGVIKWGQESSPTAGGVYFNHGDLTYTQTFENGTEDLEIDITGMVESWMANAVAGRSGKSFPNYGVGVFLTSSQEAQVITADATTDVPANNDGAKRSYYTKKFFARSSEFFYRRPTIEARWNSAEKDDRGNFFYSSSLATGEENLNTLYLYNYFRGELRNIPNLDNQKIYVSLYSGSADDTEPTGSRLEVAPHGTHSPASSLFVTGGVSSIEGIYTASVCLTAASTPLETIYDVWSTAENAATFAQYHTGSFKPSKITLSPQNPSTRFVSKITNLKSTYSTKETARFRVFTRQKEWNPNIYSKAVATIPPRIIDSGSYAVVRMVDNLEAVQYGTGSLLHTQMSFDVSGSYFDLDMGLLEPGYAYKIKLAYYNGSIGDWQEQSEEFRFRVEEG
tara:strand:+ start:2714 stop:4363 length:1650 start_codon:yes stop_codon:yes gene_type:complete